MKNLILLLSLIVSAFFGFILPGCETADMKSKNADTNVVDAEADLKDAQAAADVATTQAENAAEWEAFRTENQAKIDANNATIAELKAGLKKTEKKLDAAYSKTIDDLEIRNTELKNRMFGYKTGQTDWEKFKLEFKHDMDGIGQALKDLTQNNKN